MPTNTPLRLEHERAGAQLGVYFDCFLPERFTNPAAEYRCAQETVVLLDTNYHSLFRFRGPDRTRYLNAILTNDVQGLPPGQCNTSLLLNPQGHILAEMDVLAAQDLLTAVSHAMVRSRTAQTLEKYIIMDDVTLEDVTDTSASLALLGPASGPVVMELGYPEFPPMAENTHAEATLGGIRVMLVRRRMAEMPFVELFVERERAVDLWHVLLRAVRTQGGGPCGYQAWNSLRLEAGVPWFGYDFDDKHIPHEAALENSHISFSKGCYTGQEIVERVRSRGHVNRRRVGLEFTGQQAPEPGTTLLADGKEAGHVTSAAYSYLLGRPIGMGYVRRESVLPGSQLQWAAGAARVIELPLPELRDVSA